jgi:hypothetical protein
MSVEKAESIQSSLPANDKLMVTGHRYNDPVTNTECIEFLVDDHDCMQEFANEMYGACSGNLSVRRSVDSKPLLIFGQDKSIFNKLSFGTKQWVGPSGQRSILPKSTGIGLMISSFQGREVRMLIVVSHVNTIIIISRLLHPCHMLIVISKYGWGMEISDDQLKAINAWRNGNDYFDVIAATGVNGTTKKPPLTVSPFVILFEFDGRNGYWTGNHMILQTEDCIDCLTTIFDNQYEYVFLFDHSSGHAKNRVGCINVTSMTKGFGGELLQNTKNEQSDGYLGPFHDVNNPKMVQVGDEQQMVYSIGAHGDDGPFYLTPEKREASRHSTESLIPP